MTTFEDKMLHFVRQNAKKVLSRMPLWLIKHNKLSAC